MRRIYISSPAAEHDPTRYRRVVEILHERGAEVISTRDVFQTPKDWRVGWRKALGEATDLLVILGPQGLLGWGVVLEIVEARRRRLPVRIALPDGRILPFEQFVVRLEERTKMNRAAS